MLDSAKRVGQENNYVIVLLCIKKRLHDMFNFTFCNGIFLINTLIEHNPLYIVYSSCNTVA